MFGTRQMHTLGRGQLVGRSKLSGVLRLNLAKYGLALEMSVELNLLAKYTGIKMQEKSELDEETEGRLVQEKKTMG